METLRNFVAVVFADGNTPDKILEMTKYLLKNITVLDKSSEYNGKKVYTGPRGGRYYINKNGNKTYIEN